MTSTGIVRWNINDGSPPVLFGGGGGQYLDLVTGVTPYWSVPADVNGDGKLDVAETNGGSVNVFLNTGVGGFTTKNVTTAVPNTNTYRKVVVSDVDGDGDQDLVASNFEGDFVSWFENNGAHTPTFTAHSIDTSIDGAMAVATADIDGDGDQDILEAGANGDEIRWVENLRPVLSIMDVSATEGATIPFEISTTGTLTADVTVKIHSINGTATAGTDYTAVAPTTVTIPVGQTSVTVNIPTTGDAVAEDNETFTMQLDDPTNAGIKTGSSTVTIIDNDGTTPGQSVVSLGDASVSEGGIATFTATANPAPTSDITMTAITVEGTADSSDFTALNTVPFVIQANHTTGTVGVQTTPDTTDEPDETFTVFISNASNNAVLGDFEGTGTIVDDDPPIHLVVGDATTNEGAPAVFTVTADATPAAPVTVQADTVDLDARAPGDYTAQVAQTVTIPAGQRTGTLSVSTVGDTIDEDDEQFIVNLSNPSAGAFIDGGQGTAHITDDDGSPSLSIGDITVKEGKKGFTNFVFTVTMSAASGRSVDVDYTTADGTATQPKDYTSTTGTLHLAPGATTGQITVPVKADKKKEKKETFFVLLSNAIHATIADGQATATIKNDDH